MEGDFLSMLESYCEAKGIDLEVSPDETFEPIPSVKQFLLIMDVLEADISPILDLDCAEQSGVQRRAVVRAVFALIEGLTYCIKQMALEIDDISERRLTEPERMAIKEQAGRVDDSGQVKLRTENPPLVGNVRFAFNMLEKANNPRFEPQWDVLEVGGLGWDAFKKSISVRDRITHPKQASDLEVTEAEIESLKMAHTWFFRSYLAATILSVRAGFIRKYPGVTAHNEALNSDAPPSDGAV